MKEDIVTISEHGLPFVLIRPGTYPARKGETFGVLCTYKDIELVLESAFKSKILAIDFETRGDSSHFDSEIVGMALAWDTGSVYFSFASPDRSRQGLSWKQQIYILDQLSQHPGLIAHNVYYDGGWIFKYLRKHATWKACTLGLYMHIATEGWSGQRWGLKDAMIDVLGWKDTNEEGIDTWLIDNGYKNQQGKATKSEMWRVPPEILGPYSILDAEATYILYTEVLYPIYIEFPYLVEYHEGDYLTLVKLLIEQRKHGIRLDKFKTIKYNNYLAKEAERLKQEFLNIPEVKEAVERYENGLYQAFLETEPKKFKKFDLGPEPKKYRKSGKLSETWTRWQEKKERGPQITTGWLNWEDKKLRIVDKEIEEYTFNLNSKTQLRWLLFENLFELTDKNEFTVTISKPDGSKIDVDKTDSGLAPVSSKALVNLGKVGEILVKYNEIVKEKSYIQAYLDGLNENSNSKLYPSFRAPGTVTGRISGKEPNLLQLPKTKGTMELFIPDKGNVWLDLDFAALEPAVTAELTQDPGLMSIYGPTAKPNDIYLFIGGHIAGIKEKLEAVGYDPYNPTKEAIDRAKKECKKERNICKTVHLASAYGAGAEKIRKTLLLGGINMPIEQVKQIHRDYWELFAGVKEYQRDLEDEWKVNGGYILNAFGRPIAVADKMLKDVLNRMIQSTGHDILMKYIAIVSKELDRNEINWKPIIIDWHDAITIEVSEEDADLATLVLEQGISLLNKELKTGIKFKGEVEIARNLAEAKNPEE